MTPPTPLAATREDLARLAASDSHRPRFHFVAPGGWLNDPNGLTQRDGVFHLFYQYNPHAPVHHRIHWGHASSTDLVHWTDEPVALVPSESGPDEEGCWSGILVDDDGVPTIVYSGRNNDREVACLAVGSPDLRTWTKVSGNPVIAGPPADLDITAFRDHCVWKEGGRWRQLIGSGIRGLGGTAFLYESENLRDWTHLGPLLIGDADAAPTDDPRWTGTMWECVDLFRMHAPEAGRATGPVGSEAPGTDILVFSAWDDGDTKHPLYWTGTYEGDTFTRDRLERLDFGGRYFYAPQTFADEAGRRVLFGWLQEGRTDAACIEAGWSGVMSLPRVVTLGDDGTLRQRPAPEVDALRLEGVSLAPATLAAGAAAPLPLRGDQLDIELDLALPVGGVAEVHLRATPDGAERTTLVLTRAAASQVEVALDRTRSSLDPTVDSSPRAGEVPVGADGVVQLRVLVDHSALEVFANERPLTARIYPTHETATGVEVAATVGTVDVLRAEAWPMADAAGPDRELWP